MWNAKEELKYSATYANGQLDGIEKFWYADNANLRAETEYSNGQYDGKRLEYDALGVMTSSRNYKAGAQHGESLTYYPNSTAIKWRSNFSLGKKEGTSTLYDQEGNLLKEINYLNDIKHGETIEYDGAGNAISRELFDYGDLIETNEEKPVCECEAGDNTIKGGRYFPSISSIVEWDEILFQLDGRLQISKELYNRTFISGFNNDSYYNTGSSMNLIHRTKLSFSHIDQRGLEFVLNPCLDKNEISAIRLDAQYKYAIKDLIDDGYDPETFDESPRSYYNLALAATEYSVKDLLHAYLNTEYRKSGYDHTVADERMAEDFAAYNLAQRVDIESEDRFDQLLLSLTPDRAQFENMIFEKHFDVSTIDDENFPLEYRQFINALDAIFPSYRDIGPIALKALFDKQLALSFNNHMLGIDFPKELFTSQEPSMADGYSRILLKVNNFSYHYEDGLTFTSDTSVCFSPSALTGTQLTFNFNKVETDFSYRPRYWIHSNKEKEEFEQFCFENELSISKSILAPKPTGVWTTEDGTKFDLEYSNVYLEGELIVGKITVKKTDQWNDAYNSELINQFDDFRITDNSSSIFSGFFLFQAKF